MYFQVKEIQKEEVGPCDFRDAENAESVIKTEFTV